MKINEEKPRIQVLYDELIDSMPIEDLKDVPNKLMEEQTKLFDQISIFSTKNACEKLRNLKNPQIITWFTNYFGSTFPGTAQWVKDWSEKIPEATFWLTDLKAWGFLSNPQEKIMVIKKSARLIERIQKGENLSWNESPLAETSTTLTQNISKRCSRFRTLTSSKFFQWLTTLEGKIDKELATKLCRTFVRPERVRCTLRQLGCEPNFLNITLPQFELSLLDCDCSIIFPLLQFLEGAYYVISIIENMTKTNPTNKECSVVFLLHNREFTYYLVSEESAPFSMFEQVLQSLLKGKISSEIAITVRFQPFLYGDSFKWAPYYQTGNSYKKSSDLENDLEPQEYRN